VTHLDPSGLPVVVSEQREGCALVWVAPGVTAVTAPGQFIVYPSDGSLPYIVGDLSGFTEA
jgi:hypothetical protein